MAATLLKGNGDLSFTKPRSNVESAVRDEKLPLQLSRKGKWNSSEGKCYTEACCDLFNGSTGLTVIYFMGPLTSESLAWRFWRERRRQEGGRTAGRKRGSPLVLPSTMFSWNKRIINTDFEGHYFLTANYLQEPWQESTIWISASE